MEQPGTRPSPEQLEPVISTDLGLSDTIRHAFFTRPGGLSKGVYEGLNVGIGSDDDPSTVRHNRALATGWFGAPAENLITLYQVHSADVIVVEGPLNGERPKADGLVTKTPGLVLGVLTADCGPVLFADANSGVIGCCHAGWKGATGGVMEATIEAMEKQGAKRGDIVAVLGPTISRENYEVGPEFVDRLMALDSSNDAFLEPSDKPSHAKFDLPAYIVNRLNAADIRASWTGQCTYGDERNFFSYRRTTHRNEPDYGRQLSAICLKPQ